MQHLVFNKADVKPLQEAALMNENMNGTVYQLSGSFAVGPLNSYNLLTEESERKAWWNEVSKGSEYETDFENKGEQSDVATVQTLTTNLSDDKDAQLWLWVAQNARDVCGYYWTLQQLRQYQGQVYVVWLNNLPFLDEDGHMFYPKYMSHIPAKELGKAMKLARPVSSSEFELDMDEWNRISNQHTDCRSLEGQKKILSQPVTYYDSFLQEYITDNFQRADKVIQQFLKKKADNVTGEAFLLWRLKQMASSNVIAYQGTLATSKDFDVKKNS